MFINVLMTKIKKGRLKREIIETTGRIEFNEEQLAIAKAELEKQKKDPFSFTVKELTGRIQYYADQLSSDRPSLEDMKKEWELMK